MIRKELQEFLLRGGQMRVIASVYTGSTEKRALDELVGLGAKVKISYETAQTRLHAKAWLFERNSGFHTAYVGSSNLTHSALLDGLEWNVRATAVDNPAIVGRVSKLRSSSIGTSPSSRSTTPGSTVSDCRLPLRRRATQAEACHHFAYASTLRRSRSRSRFWRR